MFENINQATSSHQHALFRKNAPSFTILLRINKEKHFFLNRAYKIIVRYYTYILRCQTRKEKRRKRAHKVREKFILLIVIFIVFLL